MTAHLGNSGTHWYNSGGYDYEPRNAEDLQTITDCVEELLFRIVHTVAVVPVLEDIEHIRSQRGKLYDDVEAIVLRARDLPLGDDPGSSPQNDSPEQPPAQQP